MLHGQAGVPFQQCSHCMFSLIIQVITLTPPLLAGGRTCPPPTNMLSSLRGVDGFLH